MEIIRKTISVCPICLKKVKAFLVERRGQIFFKKECPEHGTSEFVVSSAPFYYRKMDKMYFTVMDNKKKLLDVMFYVTSRCNMSCPICFLSCNRDHRQ